MTRLSDSIKLLRIPFSLYLMPIFWFALSNAATAEYSLGQAAFVFFLLHLIVYPASNGYNSYFDRDEGSIGGLKHPPKVTRQLYGLVVFLDLLSVALALFISLPFAFLIVLYLGVSKAYSYDKIRLKKYPILSTVVVTFFQGAFTFGLVQYGSGLPLHLIFDRANLLLALVSSLFLGGLYPLTQVYQHDEDSRRGDRTISLMLGVNGTYIFSIVCLLLATLVMMGVYVQLGQLQNILLFLVFTLPVLFVFSRWYLQVRLNQAAVNFENTMLMNRTSSLSMTLAFLAMICWQLLF